MSSVTLYDVYYDTFYRGLKTLASLLDEAEKYAKEKGQDPEAFVKATLIEDMKPLSFQIFIATTVARKAALFIRGDPIELLPDDDTTLAQLKARVQKTLDLVKTVTPADFKGKDNEVTDLFAPKRTLKDSFLRIAVPNFFFHVQTTYSILRARGVPLGKKVYLWNFRDAE